MKWLDFVVAVIFGAPFSSDNCDLGNQYDDKVMIFGDNIYFFVRLTMIALEVF